MARRVAGREGPRGRGLRWYEGWTLVLAAVLGGVVCLIIVVLLIT